jgi:gluconokinase
MGIDVGIAAPTAACCLAHVRFPCSANGRWKVGATVTGNNDVVIGVDLGTTSSKAVAFTVDGTAVGSGQVGYRLRSRRPGYAEQDADEVRNSALEATAAAIDKATDGGHHVAGLAFSAAMHSLIGLDATGFPLTPVLTWADGRAAEQAARLRADPRGLALHKRTGTPVHPMSPLVKLRWFAENQPDVAALVGQWVGIKEYLLRRLTGELVVDHGIASATGMFNLGNNEWDDEALAYAGISATQLPEPVPTTATLRLSREGATLLGLTPGTPLIVGSSDGPLANLGLGAVRPGDVACSIGTSGAVRVVADQPLVDDRGRVFCYVLAPDRYVIGGAVNNGGIVLEWLGEAVAPDLDGGPPQLLDLASAVPAGCGGLLFLPYLMGERAPHWSGQPRGVYLGLTREHRREHLLRAALEGVCLQLALVLASLGEAGVDVRGIRATGGFSRSPLWRQILAAAFGRPIGFASSPEGSSLGAALLGMASLGLLGSLDDAAELVRVTDSTHPDRAATEAYARLLPIFDRVYDALVPTFADLNDAARHLPVDSPTA